MKTIAYKKTHKIGFIAIIILFSIGVFAFDGFATTYALEGEVIIDCQFI